MIITPKGKTSVVWKHFGFPQGTKDQTHQNKAVCKLCGTEVERAGGTSNLKTHLRNRHRSAYDELYGEQEDQSSKQSTMDSYVKRIDKLPPNCERAKKLTNRVAEMICRDIRPVSMADDVGFLSLMYEAVPNYMVPCRSTISRCIDDMYVQQKRSTRGVLAGVDYMACTTDMWTSRNGAGYISLTCHFISKDFKMSFKNLQTRHFPGSHNHDTIQDTIVSAAADWCIDLRKQVVAFTTDSGSNIVKALEEMSMLRLPCIGHTLNLAVQKGIQVRQVVTAVGRCRKLVAHFHRSRIDSEELEKKQEMFKDIKKHKLIMVSLISIHRQYILQSLTILTTLHLHYYYVTNFLHLNFIMSHFLHVWLTV